MAFTVVIPARLRSTRLPGKVLLPLGGKPMVQHVFDRAAASGAERVVIATDHEDIARAAEEFGAEVCMTEDSHPSGTDRLAEAVGKLGLRDDSIVVNVQGDEPLIPPAVIDQVAEDLEAHPEAALSTVCEPITSWEVLMNPDVVKVVCDDSGFACYFSRAPVPWLRDRAGVELSGPLADDGPWRRHIGLYAYRCGFLARFAGWPPGRLERLEQLEQLRALEHGERIHVQAACATVPAGIDSEADYQSIRGYLEGGAAVS